MFRRQPCNFTHNRGLIGPNSHTDAIFQFTWILQYTIGSDRIWTRKQRHLHLRIWGCQTGLTRPKFALSRFANYILEEGYKKIAWNVSPKRTSTWLGGATGTDSPPRLGFRQVSRTTTRNDIALQLSTRQDIDMDPETMGGAVFRIGWRRYLAPMKETYTIWN